MANNNDGQIVLGLDIPKTVSQINADIKKLQSQLDQVKTTGTLDTNATVQEINAKIKALQSQLKTIEIQATVSPANLQKQATQTGQQIGKLISDSAEKAISNVSSKSIGKYFRVSKSDSSAFEHEMEKLVGQWTNNKGKLTDVRIDTRTSYDKDAGENIERLHQATVTYSNELDEVIRKTIAWRQIGVTQNDKGEDVPLRGFVEVAAQYKKSIDEVSAKTDSFVGKQKTAAANLTNQINQINRAAKDPNSARPINETHLEELKGEYSKIISEIEVMKTSSGEAFIEQQNKVKGLISDFKSLVSEYRNMDNVSQKLKGVNLESGKKIAGEDFKKLEADAKEYSAMADTISNLKTELDKVGDSASLNNFNDKLREARAELSKFKAEASAANRSEKVGINKSDFQSKIDDLRKISPEIDKFETEINGAKVSINSLLGDLSKVNTQGDMSVLNTKWRAFTDAAKAAGIAVRDIGTSSDSSAKKIEAIQRALQVGDYKTKFESIKSTFENLGFEGDKLEKEIAEVETAFNKLKNAKSDADFIALDKEFKDAFDKANNSAKQLKLNLDEIYNSKRQSKLSTDIQNWLSKNTKASQTAKQTLQEYYRELNGSQVPVSRLEYIEKQLKDIDATQRGLGKLGKSLKDQFKQAGESFTQWLSVSSAVMFGIQKTKQAVGELKELDNILTEITKTSDLTATQLERLGDLAFDTSSKYGKKASDYLTGVQEMYRAGFDNAEQMAELSVLAQSAGDMESTSANDYLMATNAAYEYKGSIEELNKVLDSQNYITNNAAVSMQDMADATSQSASVASQYGVEIEELSALIATATAKTRESGSEVGTALKALFVNLQDTTQKPVIEAFDAVGISMTKIVDGSERLKTPIELLKELSVAFNELPEGDIKRANILNDIGKKHHANTLAAILSDWESYEDMLDLYNSSSADGSAFREAEKSANNLTGSLNRLSNTWTDTIENIVDSKALKLGVNMLNGLLTGVNNLTDALGSLGSIGTIGGIILNKKLG